MQPKLGGLMAMKGPCGEISQNSDGGFIKYEHEYVVMFITSVGARGSGSIINF